MIGGGGRHVEGIGDGEDKQTLGHSYMIPWGGLTRLKGPLKHREIPSDLGEIPINKYLSQLFLKHREIPNDAREIPILLS